MHWRLIFFIIVYAILLSSIGACTTILYDPTEHEPELVLNGMVSGGEGAWVRVSRTAAPTTEGATVLNDLWVNDAEVWLVNADDGSRRSLAFQDTGYYHLADTIIDSGQSYWVEARSPSLGIVRSEVVEVPPAGIARPPVFEERPDLELYGEPEAVSMRLSLSAVSEARYLISSTQIVNGLDGFYYLSSVVNMSDIEKEVCGFSWQSGVLYFTSRCFEETEKTVDYIHHCSQRSGLIVFEAGRIDNSYYKYLESLDQPTGLLLAFQEPIPRYSNISGGHGVFVAKHTRRYVYEF